MAVDNHGNNSKLLIFVAGAPAKATKQELIEFFSTFGSVKSIQPRLCYGGVVRSKLSGNSPKVYWLVKAADHISYTAILNAEPCIFQGRNLYLTSFRTGVQLIVHNNAIAKRRVLIKRVPNYLPEDAFISVIEIGYGPVESFFRFQSDKHHHQNAELSTKSRKYYTYSVTFSNKADRDEIVNAGQVQIAQDITVVVEKFKHLSPMKKQTMTQKTPSSLGPSKNFSSGESLLPQILQKGDESAIATAKSLTRLSKPVASSNGESRTDDRSLQETLKFPSSGSLECCFKPTSRDYHAYRHQSIAETGNQTHQKQPHEDPNLRFNWATNSISRNGRPASSPLSLN
jgi:hypothetical protein